MARDASSPPPDGGEGFLVRWSRRKAEGRAAAPPPEEPAAAAAPASPSAPPLATDERPAPLPSLDSLTADSDFTPFMRPDVPDALRRDALRKLWVSVPALAPIEVAEAHMADFNAVPTFPEGLKDTLYDVARGLIERPTPQAGDLGDDAATAAPPPREAELRADSEPPDEEPGKGADGSSSPSSA